jgi:hypothetical protein
MGRGVGQPVLPVVVGVLLACCNGSGSRAGSVESPGPAAGASTERAAGNAGASGSAGTARAGDSGRVCGQSQCWGGRGCR